MEQWTRKINDAIQYAESIGRYAYLHQHITGSMNHFAIRINRAKVVQGVKHVQSLATGKWGKYLPEEGDYLSF